MEFLPFTTPSTTNSSSSSSATSSSSTSPFSLAIRPPPSPQSRRRRRSGSSSASSSRPTGTLTCKLCREDQRRSYTNPSDLNRHVKTKHEEHSVFSCHNFQQEADCFFPESAGRPSQICCFCGEDCVGDKAQSEHRCPGMKEIFSCDKVFDRADNWRQHLEHGHKIVRASVTTYVKKAAEVKSKLPPEEVRALRAAAASSSPARVPAQIAPAAFVPHNSQGSFFEQQAAQEAIMPISNFTMVPPADEIDPEMLNVLLYVLPEVSRPKNIEPYWLNTEPDVVANTPMATTSAQHSGPPAGYYETCLKPSALVSGLDPKLFEEQTEKLPEAPSLSSLSETITNLDGMNDHSDGLFDDVDIGKLFASDEDYKLWEDECHY